MTTTERPIQPGSPPLPAGALLCRVAAVCSAGAAAVHLGVTADHFAEWWVYGVFFLLLGAFQAGWALLAWLGSDRLVLVGGAVVNAVTIVLWVVTRTSGLPLGPEAGVPEPVGAADLVAAGLAGAVVVLACVVLLRVGAGRRVGHGAAAVTTALVAVLVLGTSGVALATPGHEHDDTASAEHEHEHGDRHDLPQLPDVSAATPEQTAAATTLLQDTIEATERYRDVDVATEAGYDLEAAIARRAKLRPDAEGRIRMLHVPNRAYRSDGKVLDPTAPETLIYSQRPDGSWLLVGAMYVGGKQEPAEDAAGPYTRWHYHEACVGGGQKVRPAEDGECPEGTMKVTSGYMTHVWFVSEDDLVYAYAMSAPREQLLAYQESLY